MFALEFLLLICTLLGFGLWWMVAPEPLLFKPEALSSNDFAFAYLFKVAKDTFIEK